MKVLHVASKVCKMARNNPGTLQHYLTRFWSEM